MIKDKVIAVVVTYNRKELLMECLNAIFAQTILVRHIVVIDNASTDGTRDALKKNGYLSNDMIDYILMDANMGGSAGFYRGIQKAMMADCDWIWLMDDDTIPMPDCLERLIKADRIIKSGRAQDGSKKASTTSFLASAIYGPNGEFMNVPSISSKTAKNGYAYWYKFLEFGIVDVDTATFVSVLIKKEAIKLCGLPCRDYFIWGDDIEYTKRLSSYYGDGYFVGNSIAIHKRSGAKELRIDNETNAHRIKMFYYFYRNNLINRHFYHDNYRGAVIEMGKAILEATKYLKKKPYGILMASTVIRGCWGGITQYKKFADDIKKELDRNI